MSESLREKSNKRILVLANNDVGLYRFRKDLLAALLGAGHEVYISLPDGGFISELVQLGCRFIDTPIERRGMNPIHDGKLFHQYRAILKEVKPDLVHLRRPCLPDGAHPLCREHYGTWQRHRKRRLAQEVCAGALQTGVERCEGHFF